MVDFTVDYCVRRDIAIVAITGGCNDRCAEELKRLLGRLMSEGYMKYILDVSGLSFAETPGFRLIMLKVAELQELGGGLVVVGLCGRVERAFNLLKLGTLVPVANDVASAISEMSDAHWADIIRMALPARGFR